MIRKRQDFSKEISMYIEEGKSIREIARIRGVNHNAIRQALRLRGVQFHRPIFKGLSSRKAEDRKRRNAYHRALRQRRKVVIVETPEMELERLIKEQARDDRTICIKYDFSYDTLGSPQDYGYTGGKIVYDDIHAGIA